MYVLTAVALLLPSVLVSMYRDAGIPVDRYPIPARINYVLCPRDFPAPACGPRAAPARPRAPAPPAAGAGGRAANTVGSPAHGTARTKPLTRSGRRRTPRRGRENRRRTRGAQPARPARNTAKWLPRLSGLTETRSRRSLIELISLSPERYSNPDPHVWVRDPISGLKLRELPRLRTDRRVPVYTEYFLRAHERSNPEADFIA